ncbi:MAG TPA: 50S ribosomal protein L29 [Spirochaetota bacterium]|nr:50S ribosomal protein L29 [Spirochaetota bacterium]HOM37922.1 50S ribosomal protein L29 [Spirochaetota bacterium]HPQ48726.1 50S ribosomal protein L29 [Spirochaetota bacterium]
MSKENKKLKELSINELKKLLIEYKTKLKDMRVENTIGGGVNLSEYKKIKKDVARIYTILREYELGIRKINKEN